jgi:hypothetical protein
MAVYPVDLMGARSGPKGLFLWRECAEGFLRAGFGIVSVNTDTRPASTFSSDGRASL